MASIGNLSATISANAQQFIAEFDRADNVARRKTAAISASVDKLQTDIKKKFSASQIGTSVLSGLGIGSGFAIAERAAEQVLNYFKEAAEAAKRIEEYSTRGLEAFESRMRLGRTDEQELLRATQQRVSLEKQLAADDKKLTEASRFSGTGRGDATSRAKILATALSAESREQLRAEIEIAKLKEAQLQKSATAKQLATNEADEAQRLALIVRDVANEEELKNKSRELGVQLLKDEAEAAKELQEAQLKYASKYGPDYSAIKEIGDMTAPDIEEWTQYQEGLFEIFSSIGDRSAATFSQMVRSSEDALDSLLQSVADAFLQLSFRMGVVNPLLNAAFGLTGSSILPAFFGVGAGKADGGHVNAGMLYPVNERGVEMFAPSTSGTIIPNHKLGGGGARNVYNIDARGATTDAVKELKAMMAAMNASIEPRSVAAVRDADRRRK